MRRKKCEGRQIRNPDTDECKKCDSFKLPELQTFAKRMHVEISRHDTKEDICNKILDRIGLDGQDNFVRTMVTLEKQGVPSAALKSFASDFAQRQQQKPTFYAPPPPVEQQQSVLYQPFLRVTNAQKPNPYYLDESAPKFNTPAEAKSLLDRNLRGLLPQMYAADFHLVLVDQGKVMFIPKEIPMKTLARDRLVFDGIPVIKVKREGDVTIPIPPILGELMYGVKEVKSTKPSPSSVDMLSEEDALARLLGETGLREKKRQASDK